MNKLMLIIGIIFLLNFTSAVVFVQDGTTLTDYGVINKEYTVYSTENITLDVDQLTLIQEGNMNKYSWVPNNLENCLIKIFLSSE